MATSTAYEWDITEPVTATGAVTDGAKEIRLLRESIDVRMRYDHLQPQDTASGTPPYGMEHLEGSARCFVSGTAPTIVPYGGETDPSRDFDTTEGTLDWTGSWDNATGRQWLDQSADVSTGITKNSIRILTATGTPDTWTEAGYLRYTGGTTIYNSVTLTQSGITPDATAFQIESAYTIANDTTSSASVGPCGLRVTSDVGGIAVYLGKNGITYSSRCHLHLGQEAACRPEGHIYFDPITETGSVNDDITPSSGSAVLRWTDDGEFDVITNPGGGGRTESYIPLSTDNATESAAAAGAIDLVINGTTYNVLYK